MKPLADSHILIADDDAAICELLNDLLESEGAQITTASSGREALALIAAKEPDIALCDLNMPATDGMGVLQELRARGDTTPVLIITASSSSAKTIEAMQLGAYDYISKPFDLDEIVHTVRRALEHRRLTRLVADLQSKSARENPKDTLIGKSAAMQQVYKLIGRVAGSDATVLITGESGTGKELVAAVLHRSSPRGQGPFVAVNCAALPETLLESELFGHEKGSFTGAMTQRKGRFEQAAKGTLFLDEIGEVSPATQKKLLRVLQERTFERVGGNAPIKADVRVIAATNRDLLEDAREGSFREDLYYRLNVVNIHMPPLRDRKDDIPLLVEHFLHKHRFSRERPSRILEAAMEQLMEHEWPGNVRQLENTIERAVVLSQGGLIGPEHLLLSDSATAREQILDGALARMLGGAQDLGDILAGLRQRLVALALERSNGDTGAAARLLGVETRELR